MEAASFTAWQLLVAKGYKKGWGHYRKGMGLDPKQDKKVTKDERQEAIAAALEIDKLYGNGAKRGGS